MIEQLAVQIASACSKIADRAVDERGFVSLRRLLDEMQVSLVSRPLLVEGMVAIQQGELDSQSSARWMVLVDSETSGVSETQADDALAKERFGAPLGSRLRNTVAHELVHTLAFRPSEFGIRLAIGPRKSVSAEEFVREVERQTERFSPLLLLPVASLRSTIGALGSAPTADDLVACCRQLGVSRHVLLSRLKLASDAAGTSFINSSLPGTGVGLGEWGERGRPLLRSTLPFVNFDNGLVPTFLLDVLAGRDRIPLDDTIRRSAVGEATLTPTRGTFRSKAGTASAPDLREMDVEISLETNDIQKGRPFLYVVRGRLLPSPQRVVSRRA